MVPIWYRVPLSTGPEVLLPEVPYLYQSVLLPTRGTYTWRARPATRKTQGLPAVVQAVPVLRNQVQVTRGTCPWYRMLEVSQCLLGEVARVRNGGMLCPRHKYLNHAGIKHVCTAVQDRPELYSCAGTSTQVPVPRYQVPRYSYPGTTTY